MKFKCHYCGKKFEFDKEFSFELNCNNPTINKKYTFYFCRPLCFSGAFELIIKNSESAMMDEIIRFSNHQKGGKK